MTDERDTERAGEEVFGMLDYARARFIELTHVLWMEMDEQRARQVALEFLMAAEWRRRAVRAAVRFLTMTSPRMRVKFDPDGLLGGMAIEPCEPRDDGFRAETVRFVSGPAPIGNGPYKRWSYDFTDKPIGNGPYKRWSYDFTDKQGNSIRISLPQAIDDLWTTRDTDNDPKN